MTIQELHQYIEEIPFDCNVSVDADELGKTIHITPDEGYFTNDEDDLTQSWEDFKKCLANLRTYRVFCVYEDNQAPSFSFPDWEIIIRLDKNLYLKS